MSEPDTDLDAAVARVKRQHPIDENPYFRSLRDGSFERDDFVETQVQFLFAVVFFSRPMAALAGRLARPERRVALLENISDEHGHGNLRVSHERTFLALLGRLGVTPEEVERRALWPEVRAFNTVLAGVATLDDTPTALAAMGVIEDLFARISARIGRAIVDRGWLPEDQIVHYATHERLDEQHAEGFYAQLRAPFARHPRHAYQVTQGLELGAHIFLRLYEDLWRARERRVSRTVRGPHSLSDGWSLED
jgi:pyrroloquinoline quinone (PQQ) biosynthesis protein C